MNLKLPAAVPLIIAAEPVTPSVPGWVHDVLNDPGKLYQHLGDSLLSGLQAATPFLAAGTVAVTAVGGTAVAFKGRSARRVAQGCRYLRVLPPPEIDPDGAPALWSNLHGLIRSPLKRLIYGQPHFAWEVSATGLEADVGLWVAGGVPPGLVEAAVQSAWPGATAIAAEAPCFAKGLHVSACELKLAQGEEFPLGPGQGDDPLRLMLATFGLLEQTEQAMIQILARPATARRQYQIRRAAKMLKRSQSQPAGPKGRPAGPRIPDPTVDADVRAIMDKASSVIWEVVIRVAAGSPSRESARGKVHGLAAGFNGFSERNWLARGRLRGGLKAIARRSMPPSFALSSTELARMAALPGSAALPSLERSRARTVAPPRDLPDKGKPLGVADHPSYGRNVALAVADTSQHIHLIGETGTGKSTLISQMVLADAAEGRAAVVIDPKGDLVNSIIARMPGSAVERTCLMDPDDAKVAVGLNVLSGDNPDLVVDQVVSVFKRIYADAWGARSDDIMRCACLTLTQVPGSTLADVGALLTNDQYRQLVTGDPERFKQIGDLALFWQWYEDLGPQRAMNIGPLMNKLRAFLLRGPVRAIVGQSQPKLDIANLIDTGGLLLVRIPKGTVGEETSRILGAFVVARVWQACMARVRREEEERPPVGLYVDEMHNYLALPRSFEDMLAEARGYGLGMVLAHQHMGQLTRDVSHALGANARTKISFAVSPEDASALSRHFAPHLSDYDLANLAAFQAACRPCIGGAHGSPFTFRTTPLDAGSKKISERVKAASAENFAHTQHEVDTDLKGRTGQLEAELTDESVGESPGALRLDRQPVPVLRRKKR